MSKLENENNNNFNSYDIDEKDLAFYEAMQPLFDWEEPLRLDNKTPDKHIMLNNRLMNTLASGKVTYGETLLNVSGNPKKETLTKISLNYDDEKIQIYDKEKRFTRYDRAIYDTLSSIHEAGNKVFTANQVYRYMNGLDNKESTSPQMIGAITKSIDKQRRMYGKIDYTEEAKAWGKNTDSFIVEDYILAVKKITIEAGGKEVLAYQFNSKPILYEYAQISGQVLTIPSELLNIKDFRRSSQEVIIIRNYLIRRIEVMKRKGNKAQSNKILFKTLYDEIELLSPTKEKANKIRTIVKKILDSFIEKKYIKSYTFYKKGQSYEGIEILY